MVTIGALISQLRSSIKQLDEVMDALRRTVSEYLKCGQADYIINIVANIASSLNDPITRRFVLEKLFSEPVGENIRVAYLGPEGSFCHEVLRSLFKRSVEEIDCTSITEVFEKVQSGQALLGLVPLENSLEGIVHETIDNLEERRSVYMNLCIEHRIRLCLAVSDDVESLDDVRVLYAQPYALAQCRTFISRYLRSVDIVHVTSTSRALQYVKTSSRSACLCSCTGARSLGVKILAEDVQDGESYTKFALISKTLTRAGDRVSIIFTVKHEPGALYRALEVFARRSINLTMIYSRPLRKIPWRYYFYLEYEGDIDEEVIDELEQRCTSIRIVGQYPIVAST